MAAKSQKKNGRGGYRKGAGRKPTLRDPVRLTVSIDGEDFDTLVGLAKAEDVVLSDYVRRLLKRHTASKRRRGGR